MASNVANFFHRLSLSFEIKQTPMFSYQFRTHACFDHMLKKLFGLEDKFSFFVREELKIQAWTEEEWIVKQRTTSENDYIFKNVLYVK